MRSSLSRRHPADALLALAGELEAGHRVRGMYLKTCSRVGVLSVALGVTVWSDGRRLWWYLFGEQHGWSASDPQGAARTLAPYVKRVSLLSAPRKR
jgi:hypothetical protein